MATTIPQRTTTNTIIVLSMNLPARNPEAHVRALEIYPRNDNPVITGKIF
jgi:hypothetical protein